MNGLGIVKSVSIGTNEISNSNVTFSDYSAYNANTTYSKQDRRYFVDSVYESLQDDNQGNDPDEAYEYWQRVGPVNRLKPFDLSDETKAIFSSSCYYTLTFSEDLTDLVLLGLDGVTSVNVKITKSGSVVYDQGFAITSDHLLVSDLPADSGATIRIDFVGGSGAGIGTLAMGKRYSVGIGVLHGLSLDVEDFSRRDRNEYGDVQLKRRPFAKDMSLTAIIPNADMDEAYELLAGMRATPCLWIPSKRKSSLRVWGFCESIGLGVTYPTYSEINLELKGFA